MLLSEDRRSSYLSLRTNLQQHDYNREHLQMYFFSLRRLIFGQSPTKSALIRHTLLSQEDRVKLSNRRHDSNVTITLILSESTFAMRSANDSLEKPIENYTPIYICDLRSIKSEVVQGKRSYRTIIPSKDASEPSPHIFITSRSIDGVRAHGNQTDSLCEQTQLSRDHNSDGVNIIWHH